MEDLNILDEEIKRKKAPPTGGVVDDMEETTPNMPMVGYYSALSR